MTDKSFSAIAEQVHVPLEPLDDETIKLTDSSAPPAYEHPKIEFSNGWKDRGFAFTFWLYMIAVIIVGLVLGIPAVGSYVKHLEHHQNQTIFDININLFVYSFGGAIATAGLMSFVTFILFQICAGRLIAFSLTFIIIIQLAICVCLGIFAHWGAAIVPIIILLFTLIFTFLIRKRIKFAETHIRVGCAVLRSHPSLILVAIFMLVLQIMWFLFWSLMVIGILRTANRPLFDRFIYKTTTNLSSTTRYPLNKNDFVWTTKLPTTMRNTIYRKFDDNLNDYEKSTSTQTTTKVDWHVSAVANIITFLTLTIWYWAAVTFANIVHFISACAVGHWWFSNDNSQQYTMKKSIKRSLTTNFGTICFGSLLEAIIKALRTCLNEKKHRNFIAWCAECILSLIEKIIGYINEGAFIYSALTGQSFLKASKSFIELFKQRGWTMVLNDSIVGYCLAIINVVVGLTSAVVGSLIIYLFFSKSSEEVLASIITISIIGFFLGLILNATMTTILKSCVRTIFVCFALNPAALGATHPEYLHRLTNVWHEFYPNEFATSGYAAQFPKLSSENSV